MKYNLISILILIAVCGCRREDESARIDALSAKIDSLSKQAAGNFELTVVDTNALLFEINKTTGEVRYISKQGLGNPMFIKVLSPEDLLSGIPSNNAASK